MLGLIFGSDGSFRIGRLFALDVAAILLVILAVSLHVVPPTLAVLIGFPILLVGNVIVIWRASRHAPNEKSKGPGVRKSHWLAAGVLTVISLNAVTTAILRPSLETEIPAFVTALVAGYAWFVVYRRRQSREQGGDSNS